MTKNNNIELSSVYRYFKNSIIELEVANTKWHNNQKKEFIIAIQSSAGYLMKALFSSQGHPVSEQRPLVDQLNDRNDTNDFYQAHYDVINNILSFSTESENENIRIKSLYYEYQSALISARQALKININDNDITWRGIKSKLISLFAAKKISIPILALVVLIITSVSIYQSTNPIDSYDVGGQVYWKSSPNIPFTANSSFRFPVFSDNLYHEYSVEFDSPTRIFLLRLDPVNTIGLSEIEIEAINFYGNNNKLLRKLYFDKMYWSCENCIKLENNSSAYLMRPTSNDPYITSSKIDQYDVKKITFKMRAVSRKTFLEWILSIDKSMEF